MGTLGNIEITMDNQKQTNNNNNNNMNVAVDVVGKLAVFLKKSSFFSYVPKK